MFQLCHRWLTVAMRRLNRPHTISKNQLKLFKLVLELIENHDLGKIRLLESTNFLIFSASIISSILVGLSIFFVESILCMGIYYSDLAREVQIVFFGFCKKSLLYTEGRISFDGIGSGVLFSHIKWLLVLTVSILSHRLSIVISRTPKITWHQLIYSLYRS